MKLPLEKFLSLLQFFLASGKLYHVQRMHACLRPANKGAYTLKPRVMYLDETGKYRSHEPEPVTITVKELGIKGWIKGEK